MYSGYGKRATLSWLLQFDESDVIAFRMPLDALSLELKIAI